MQNPSVSTLLCTWLLPARPGGCVSSHEVLSLSCGSSAAICCSCYSRWTRFGFFPRAQRTTQTCPLHTPLGSIFLQALLPGGNGQGDNDSHRGHVPSLRTGSFPFTQMPQSEKETEKPPGPSAMLPAASFHHILGRRSLGRHPAPRKVLGTQPGRGHLHAALLQASHRIMLCVGAE